MKKLLLCVLLFLVQCTTYSHTKYKVDKDFTSKYNLTLPVSFNFALDHELRGYANPSTLKKMGIAHGVMSFAFFADKEKTKVSEDVLIIQGKMPSADFNKNLGFLKQYCQNNDHLKKRLGEGQCATPVVSETKVGHNQALQCSVSCQSKGKTVVKSSTYIFYPSSEHFVHVDSTYYPEHSQVKTAEDVGSKGLKGGVAYLLKTFEFGDKF